jgi:uncharacterized protein (DUF885 family)
MKSLWFLLLLPLQLFAQSPSSRPVNAELHKLFDDADEEFLKLNPISATFRGDNRYNDKMPIDFTDSYREKQKAYFTKNLEAIKKFKRDDLNDNDKLSYDVFKWQTELALGQFEFRTNRIPFNQFFGLQITLPLLGSGTGAQPFKSVPDYKNWLSRAANFPAWSDSAIVYFKKDMAENYVLPKALVLKMIPQLNALIKTDITQSTFYGPIKNIPTDFSESDQKDLATAYEKMISNQLMPAFKKLTDFLQNEYLPQARATSGIGSLPNGAALYRFLVRTSTTTNKTPDEIYNIGLAEVKRIRDEMEMVKKEVGFSGDLKSFFEYMNSDPKFFPYSTAEQVLDDYRAIEKKIDPPLGKLFLHKPKTPFEVRQTEAFRAATSAAQYFAGSLENNRPGIFYVPIVDPKKYTIARESLFLHEAIPGHHYQISLQRENESIPKFQRFGGFTAYAEGWGLYAESLGKELGAYKDPYQHMLALGDEIHRAIRLVTDVGMHEKGWAREQAVKYMMDNEPIDEQRATAEIERYMAIPSQALAYKVGALKIQELRKNIHNCWAQNLILPSFMIRY